MASTETSILATLIPNGDWKQAVTFCEADAELSSRWYSLPDFYDRSHDEEMFDVLPIHHACANQPSVKMIQVLIDSYPNCVKIKDPSYLRLPLHIACRSGASEETISSLLESYPEGAGEKDILGRLPLHYACANAASNQVIQKLVDSYPQGCREKDMKGWIPLHILVSKKEKSFKVKYVLDAYPEGMDVKTSGGSTPRDLAKGMRMKFRIRTSSRSSGLSIIRRNSHRKEEKCSDSCSTVDISHDCDPPIPLHARGTLGESSIRKSPTFAKYEETG
uniref:Uncharacterized protein n=1 Tax=Ditylum brightwellii TaxID=49249 RepID=A0A6U3WRE8_9STRA|mmetsp:Transcript_19323/g.28836  ORF Transcript_19323/g.28836 Transcript_19323/m.28836 type:complete len:276 (+) Transcript_19323:43-870(+)